MIAFLQGMGLSILVVVLTVLLIFIVLLDVFEVVILPRRITRPLRLSVVVRRVSWWPWVMIARKIKDRNRRENFLGIYGPLGLLFLLFIWILGIIVGFASLQWACGSPYSAPEGVPNFGTDLYVSGTNFFTLGLGDVIPRTAVARVFTIIEAGMGFGILAIVIGYLPVLYQAFSRREVTISLMDARAGSPPCASELILRMARIGNVAAADQLLAEWERWSAELLESHLSFPLLGYYRSQHDNQSWLAAITTMLDTCALILAGIKSVDSYRAQLTFAMARHAVVDLSL